MKPARTAQVLPSASSLELRMTLHSRSALVIALLIAGAVIRMPAAERGAAVPWTTYEAEDMRGTQVTVLGPPAPARDRNAPLPSTVESEASGRRCVRLDAVGAALQWTAQGAANAVVVRYSLPDAADGGGLDSRLALFVNDRQVATLPVTSRCSWRYGGFPFRNDPHLGNPRNFFDEVRVKGLAIALGDTLRIERVDAQLPCTIDLVDLEPVPAPLPAPAGALDVTAAPFAADPSGRVDATAAFRACLAAAGPGKAVWIPAGRFLISGDLDIPAGMTLQGAGMRHSTLVGDPAQYNLPDRGGERKRVRLNGGGSGIHVADFAILGCLDHREDSEANDGFSETFGTGSTISRVWVEHTKTGAWIANSRGLVVDSCRFRNTIADGINLCVGVREAVVRNCSARGTGDDAFAIWPATYAPQAFAPGLNVISACTAALASFGSGVGVYGGEGNSVQDCRFTDVPCGCGVLVAGTFPIGGNGFSGTTLVQRCDLLRCGGFDTGWNAWRGALTICPQANDITGLRIDQVTIRDSLSYALQFANPGNRKVLGDAAINRLEIAGYGVAVPKAAPEPRACDGVHAVLADAKGGVAFHALAIDGLPITHLPAAGTAIRPPRSEFTMTFSAAPWTAGEAIAHQRPHESESKAPVVDAAGDAWFKGITAADLSTSSVNGATIVGLQQGVGQDLVLTYAAGQQYGIHQIEYVDKLTTADLAGHHGIRITLTSANYGRLIVLPRDYQADGRAYEGSADISQADRQTYDIPFAEMGRPGWSKGAGFADAAAAIAAGEHLDTLTIGWVCNTAGLAGTVVIHRVELY